MRRLINTPPGAFTLVQTSASRVEVRLLAELGEAEVCALQEALFQELEARGSQPFVVVMDLSRLRTLSLQARQGLYRLQAALASHGVRTTYTAHAPRLRRSDPGVRMPGLSERGGGRRSR